MNRCILLVDDEAAIRLGFGDYLSSSGHAVYGVRCLAEAREAILTMRFDVVLLDLKLPDGNGAELIPAVRDAQPEAAIVVITGHRDTPLAEEATHLGVDRLLAKPVDMEVLDGLLREGLRS